MNIVLWGLQIILAIKLLSIAFSHGVLPDEAKMQRGRERFGRITRPLLTIIALCAFLAGVALVLPAATGIMIWLVPWAAAFVALLMLVAVGFRVGCHDLPNTGVSLILLVLAAFLAYGRWVLSPL